MEQLNTFLTSLWALLVVALLHPSAAAAVGGFVGGYTLGVAKNKTAFAELFRGIVAGAAAWGLTTVVQILIAGGGA